MLRSWFFKLTCNQGICRLRAGQSDTAFLLRELHQLGQSGGRVGMRDWIARMICRMGTK